MLERQLIRLQVEEKALEKEKDKQSQERLGEVRRELGELQDRLKPLQMRYRQEKAALDEIKVGPAVPCCCRSADFRRPRCRRSQ